MNRRSFGEIDALRDALSQAMFSALHALVEKRCVDASAAGVVWEYSWTDTARRYARLAHVDLGKFDPGWLENTWQNLVHTIGKG